MPKQENNIAGKAFLVFLKTTASIFIIFKKHHTQLLQKDILKSINTIYVYCTVMFRQCYSIVSIFETSVFKLDFDRLQTWFKTLKSFK